MGPVPAADDFDGQARWLIAWIAAYQREGRTFRQFWADFDALELPLVTAADIEPDAIEAWTTVMAHADVAGFLVSESEQDELILPG